MMSCQSNLSILNDDLLVRVTEKISSDADRKAWRLVCKNFFRAESLTRTSLRVLRIEFLLGLLRKYTNINTLDLSDCPRINDGTISVLVTCVPVSWSRGLRRLVLTKATGLRYGGLKVLIGACPLLEAIDVSHCCDYGDMEAAALSYATGLKEVRLDKCLRVTDVGLAKIAIGCSKLEMLSVKWCMEISDLAIDLLCKKCLDLKALDISYLKVTNESLSSIASLPKLEVLTMVKCSFLDDVGLKFLENGCPLLQAIDVSRCNRVSSSGLISIIRGHSNLLQIDAAYSFSEFSTCLQDCSRNLKNLRKIRIDGIQVSDSILWSISTYCNSLMEICLNKCIGLTNSGILHLVSGCVNLKVLNLSCCGSITDQAISAIAESCPNIVCLQLESCNMVTEKSLYQLGSHCMLLQELDLTDCIGIDDTALFYVSKCSGLLSLKLGLCTNISDKGLKYIAGSCSQMVELDLYRCTRVGDDGLAALSKGCKKLMKLNLSYCINVTDRGIESISHLDELSDLELRALTNITSVGLKALVAGCNRLADLDLKQCDKIDDLGFSAIACRLLNLRQINLSYCAVSDMALCMIMGNLKRLQDAKLVDLIGTSVEGLELALRAACGRLKKVKLLASLRFLLSSEILEALHASGCRIRWD